MKWLELKIDAAPAGLEPVSALLEDLGITGLVIDDEGDFQDFLEHNHAYWDYVDDQLMQEKKGLCRITFYLEDSPDGYNTLAQVRMALSRVKQEHPEYGRLLLTMENMEDADWENNWKQFYKPMEIGDRLTVIPDHRLFGHRVDLFNLLFLTDGCRCDDLDSFFPTFYMAVKFLLPCLIPRYQCCFRFLHSDQQCIIKTVIMELGHGIQIFCISLRSKDFFYSLLQPFQYFF